MANSRIDNNRRIRTLESYELMDTLPESVYDEITKLAAAICNTPIGLITLIDDKRQYFKSFHGIDLNEIPLEHSFCQYIIKDDADVLIVEDAKKDARFADNPMVQNAPNVSFYAGVSLTTPLGFRLGALCVIDDRPKKLSEIQINGLQTLAKQVVQLFEFRKTKKEIEKKNLALEKIFDTSLDIICTLDEDGIFRTVSKASEKIWGYSPDELIGKNYIDFVYHEDRFATLKSEKLVISGEQETNFENKYVHKNGSLIPMLWSSKSSTGDGIVYCVAKDITEKKKAQHHLEQSERRFKTLVQEGSDLIGILDLEANYNYVSPTSLKVLQIAPEEFIGTNAFDYIHPEDQESVFKQFKDAIEKSQVIIEPFRFKNKEGNWRWIETIATNQIKEPSINGIVTNSRDVTDRVLYLKAIKKQNSKLKEIAWTQSHIVRAPVARLMGLIDLIRNEKNILDSEEKEQVLNFIFQSADEIDTVIKQTVQKTANAIDPKEIK